MKTTLVLFFLSIQSSYKNNSEIDATDEKFDTIQFYSSGEKDWRIKTYAQDEDVHMWELGPPSADLVSIARANTEKHYGDVLTEGYIIETDEGIEGIRKELEKRGLEPNLELPPAGAVFWAPEGTEYRTKSRPQ